MNFPAFFVWLFGFRIVYMIECVEAQYSLLSINTSVMTLP